MTTDIEIIAEAAKMGLSKRKTADLLGIGPVNVSRRAEAANITFLGRVELAKRQAERRRANCDGPAAKAEQVDAIGSGGQGPSDVAAEIGRAIRAAKNARTEDALRLKMSIALDGVPKEQRAEAAYGYALMTFERQQVAAKLRPALPQRLTPERMQRNAEIRARNGLAERETHRSERVMAALLEHGEMNRYQLAEVLGIGPSSVGDYTRTLIADGKVARLDPNTHRSRYAVVSQ